MHAHGVADAHRAHDALVRALHTLENAEQNAVLRFADLYHARLFRLLGYASIHHYAIDKLGFSRSKAAQFVRLAKDVKRLPTLAAAIEKQEVSWTAAREVGRVATPENERDWVERAKQSSRRDRAELFVDALEALAAAEQGEQTEEKKYTRVQPPVQIVAYECGSCHGVDVPTGSGLKRLSPPEADAIACDADRIDTQGHRRSAIPPRIRCQVLARDRHCCVRCGRTGFLHVHHRQPQADGGRHSLENCVTVCGPCHRVHHG